MANATGSPECETFCVACIHNRQLPDPILDHWFNGVHQTSATINENFMMMVYEFIMNEELFDYEGTEQNPKTIDILDLDGLLKSGINDWDYNHEGVNEFDPKSTMHSISTKISVAVTTLFTTIGFDMSVYWPNMNKFALMPHTSPTVNNRPINLESVLRECGRIDGKPDTTKSLWHYLTHYGLDHQKDNCIEATKALTLLAKRVSRNKLPTVQPHKDRMAPFNDMWFFASSTALDSVDKSEEQTILGDPVAVPATFKDVKEVFKLITGKDFDTVFKVVAKNSVDEEKIDSLNDDMKALVCFLEIASTLTQLFKPKNNINCLQGRLKLFGLLMRNRFGIKRIAGIVEFAKSYPKDRKARLMNSVLPCTPGELHLRMMFLFNDATQVTLLPMESQKRQVASLFNYLEQRPSENSILSNIFYDERLRFERPPINVEYDGSDAMWKQAEELAKPYFLRSGCFVDTEVLGFKKVALGLTKRQGAFLKGTSTEKAIEGGLAEPKAVSDFFADALRMSAWKEETYSMNVTKVFPPITLEKVTKATKDVMNGDDAGKYQSLCDGCEKKIKHQIKFMRRFFIMILVEFNNNPSTKNQANFFLNKIREHVQKLADAGGVQGVNKKGQPTFVPLFKHSGKPDEDLFWKNFRDNVGEYASKCVDGHFHVYDTTTCIYEKTELIIPAAHEKDLCWFENCSNPSKPEFWYSLWILNSFFSGISDSWMHWFPAKGVLKPDSIITLSTLFSHAVFSKLSMRNLIALFANNGSRAIKYEGEVDWLVQDHGMSKKFLKIVSTV